MTERKNDALGRPFIETRFVDGQRVTLPNQVPREYTIAGRYTSPLTDKEARQLMPAVFPTVQTVGTDRKKRFRP